jgi:hypothetical protein
MRTGGAAMLLFYYKGRENTGKAAFWADNTKAKEKSLRLLPKALLVWVFYA